MKRIVSVVLIAVALPPGLVVAQETDAESKDINAVGFFLGATTKFKSGIPNETSFTVAGEYEHRPAKWDHKWGIAGAIELIFAHELEALLLPMVYYHPAEEWFVRGGIGLEVAREEDATSNSAHLLIRAGVGYSVPVRNFLLVPSVDFDIVRSDVSVAYGVAIAKEF